MLSGLEKRVLLGLGFLLAAYKGEREVEQAHEHQENRDNTGNDASEGSFALHVLDKNCYEVIVNFRLNDWLSA